MSELSEMSPQQLQSVVYAHEDTIAELKTENERLKAVETMFKERPPVMDNAEVEQLKKQVCSVAPCRAQH